MSEKRFTTKNIVCSNYCVWDNNDKPYGNDELVDLLNEQQELIEELQVSDEMGWKRAERFEKKCPKELHNKKMYIKRLEYKVQKFKEENEKLIQKKCLPCELVNLQTREIDKLKEENEQLKEENESFKQRIRDIKFNGCD